MYGGFCQTAKKSGRITEVAVRLRWGFTAYDNRVAYAKYIGVNSVTVSWRRHKNFLLQVLLNTT